MPKAKARARARAKALADRLDAGMSAVNDLEGCTYINGSPQNTFVPGVIELAETHDVMIGGDDFKSVFRLNR